MPEIPETRESLLLRLHDPRDRDAWNRFMQLYRPVVYRLARGRGLQDADAQDLVQHVLMAVAASIPRWRRVDPDVKFRHWLRRVCKNATINALSRIPKDQACGGTTFSNLMQQCTDEQDGLEEAIEWEHRREVYRRASLLLQTEVNEESWQIFRMIVIDGRSAGWVAEHLGKSIGSVYVARCRTMNRLREIAREVDGGL